MCFCSIKFCYSVFVDFYLLDFIVNCLMKQVAVIVGVVQLDQLKRVDLQRDFGAGSGEDQCAIRWTMAIANRYGLTTPHTLRTRHEVL